MSKRVPNEERRVSTTFAVSQNTLRLIDTMSEYLGMSRSGIVNVAISFYHRWLVYDSGRNDEDPHELPADMLKEGDKNDDN